MSEIQDQVKKIVVDHLGIDESKVVPEAKFIDDLGADSLDTVELVMAFEEKFGIEIPDDAAETIQTVQNAIDYIQSKKINFKYNFMRRVVVTGMGLLTSIGNNKDISWDNLINKKSGIKKINHFDVSDLPAKIAGYINNNPEDENYFNKSSFLEQRDIKRNDRFIQYGLSSCKNGYRRCWFKKFK